MENGNDNIRGGAHVYLQQRIGYAVGEPGMIAAFDKIRNHFGIGRISQVKKSINTV